MKVPSHTSPCTGVDWNRVGTRPWGAGPHPAPLAVCLLPEFRWASLAALCAETLEHALFPVPD